MTQQPTTPPESRASKRLLLFVIGSMLVTFVAAIATVIWIGLHVLDARHDAPAPAHTNRLTP